MEFIFSLIALILDAVTEFKSWQELILLREVINLCDKYWQLFALFFCKFCLLISQSVWHIVLFFSKWTKLALFFKLQWLYRILVNLVMGLNFAKIRSIKVGYSFVFEIRQKRFIWVLKKLSLIIQKELIRVTTRL